MSRIEEEFAKHPLKLRKAYNRLDEQQQIAVIRKFTRHARACDIAECETDPRFLFEVIEDMKKGFDV